MSNSGYGSHDDKLPGGGETPKGAGPIATDAPPPAAPAGGPGPVGTDTRMPGESPAGGGHDTPRDGAGAQGPQGDEVDPGVG